MRQLNSLTSNNLFLKKAHSVIWQVGYRLLYSLILTFFTICAVLPVMAIVHQWQSGSFGSIFNILIDIIYFPLILRGNTNIYAEDIVLAACLWIGIFAIITYIHDRYATPQRPWTESITQTVHGPYIFVYVCLCCALPYLPGSDMTDLRSSYILIATFFFLGYAAYWMARILQWVRLELDHPV